MNEPHAIQVLIQIAGAAALLIWAVRLVRTGVERGFAAPMRFWLRHSAKNRLLAAGTGMGAAVLLQSSTAQRRIQHSEHQTEPDQEATTLLELTCLMLIVMCLIRLMLAQCGLKP